MLPHNGFYLISHRLQNEKKKKCNQIWNKGISERKSTNRFYDKTRGKVL